MHSPAKDDGPHIPASQGPQNASVQKHKTDLRDDQQSLRAIPNLELHTADKVPRPGDKESRHRLVRAQQTRTATWATTSSGTGTLHQRRPSPAHAAKLILVGSAYILALGFSEVVIVSFMRSNPDGHLLRDWRAASTSPSPAHAAKLILVGSARILGVGI
jgi:hypothetical protein